ncbi:phage protein [[Clostridium] sordellii]|uniref:putative phage tail protein n=1 Tax=Paraclostridium sordellii TaxID=1505 RepID=UPI0005E6B574|nr:putative phage tail protein [Paeniclostridium sordellii]CEP39560.1 phage protein [[Clostridium] sordellii] [Paeniclostridium sordellii]
MINIKNYFPTLYNDILEIDSLVKIENDLFENLNTEFEKAIKNEYVITADKETIKKYEILLRINDGDNKELSFRRKRILNRLAMNMPFTLRALKQKLDELIGKGNYNIFVDPGKFTLYIESKILNQTWFNETYITINKMKPANIVFINKPFVDEKILANEELMLAQREYNYKLGSTWRLGTLPFKSLHEKGAIKLKQNNSIQKYFLDELKGFALSKIGYVKLNNVKVIKKFITKDIVNEKLTLEYAVLHSFGLDEITKVDIYTSDNKLLTSIDLYVPIIEDIELKHVINIEEGVN